MTDIERRMAEAELLQKKGQMLQSAEEAGLSTKDEQPTEYAKSAKKVVDKMFDPQTEEDKQLLSSIPRNILPNTMMLVGIENAMRRLVDADVVLIDPQKDKVSLFKETDEYDSNTKSNKLVRWRTMTTKGYGDTQFWADYWHGFVGGLFLQLPAVDGKSRTEGVQVVSAITNSDRALIEAQNNANAGIFRKIWSKTFGK